MCRNIKTLFNFEPPATELEIRDAALQFVRKLSGFNTPSQANQAAFDQAGADVAASARSLIASLVTSAAAQGLTLVVYMGVSQLESIVAGLADALAAAIGSPAVLIVGNVLQGVQAVAQATPPQRSAG